MHSFLKLLQLHCATFRLKTFIQFLWEMDQVQFYAVAFVRGSLLEVMEENRVKKSGCRYLLGMLLDSNGKLVVLGATPVQTSLISLMHPFIHQLFFLCCITLWDKCFALVQKILKIPPALLFTGWRCIQMISAMSNSRSCTD